MPASPRIVVLMVTPSTPATYPGILSRSSATAPFTPAPPPLLATAVENVRAFLAGHPQNLVY